MDNKTSKTAVILLLFSFLANAQVGKICNWENNKKAAVVLTFDDWTAGQYPIAVPELKKRNLQASFFIITNMINETWAVNGWSTLIITAANGNEIANHTIDHSDQASPSATAINGAKTALKSNDPSQEVSTFAYPLGSYSNATIQFLKANGYVGARGVYPSSGNYTYDFATTTDDYYKILTTTMNGSVTLGAFIKEIDNTIKGGGLLTYMYHSIDSPTITDNAYATLPQSAFISQLDALVSYKKSIWVTTFAKALKYHRERKCASLTETKAPNGLSWELNLTDTLANNNLYNQGLSIQLKANGVKYDQITQNGIAIQIDSVFNDTIMFKAIPDAGQIVLKASNGIFLTSLVNPTIIQNSISNTIKFTANALAAAPHSISKVALDLSSIGGSNAVSMTPIGNNNYELSYSVTSGLTTGTKTILVTATDNLGNVKSINLSLEISGGTIITTASVSPSSVENTISSNLKFQLTATDDGFVSTVNLDVSAIGGGTSVSMNSIGNNNYSLDFTLSPLQSVGTKTIMATVTDNLGNKKTQAIQLTIKPSYSYLNIYTDASTMICSNCFWTSGTLTEQSNAGAMEGIKDYLFSYSGTWNATGFNICNWNEAEAKNFSVYDSLEISYKGPTTTDAILNVYLFANSDIKSSGKTIPLSNAYKTIKISVKDFAGVDLSKIKLIQFEVTGLNAVTGKLQIDNIRLYKLSTTVVTSFQHAADESPSLIAYPNPSNGTFTITSEKECSYVILNSLGQLIQQINLNTSNGYSRQIELLESGLYLIVGNKGFSKTSQKMIITK